MKNYRPEMVLGASPGSPLSSQEGSLGSLGSIRVGSFSGKPVTPKVSLQKIQEHQSDIVYMHPLLACVCVVTTSVTHQLHLRYHKNVSCKASAGVLKHVLSCLTALSPA